MSGEEYRLFQGVMLQKENLRAYEVMAFVGTLYPHEFIPTSRPQMRFFIKGLSKMYQGHVCTASHTRRRDLGSFPEKGGDFLP